MRVIHFDSALHLEHEVMTELIRRVNQQPETVILFLETIESAEDLPRIQNQLAAAVGHAVHVAPEQSIEWKVTINAKREKQVTLGLKDFLSQPVFNEEGQIVLLSKNAYFTKNKGLNQPSTQLLTALLAQVFEATYRIYIEANNAYYELLEAPFSGCISYELLKSYMAITKPLIATDLLKQLANESFEFEIMGVNEENQRILVLPNTLQPVSIQPIMMKQTGDYYKLTIQHYQLHRTPEMLTKLVKILDEYELIYMIHSTSVDGIVFYIQKPKEAIRVIKAAVKGIKKSLKPDRTSISVSQAFISVAFNKEITQSEVIANLLELFIREDIKAEIVGSIYSKSSITCSVETSQAKQLTQILKKGLLDSTLSTEMMKISTAK